MILELRFSKIVLSILTIAVVTDASESFQRQEVYSGYNGPNEISAFLSLISAYEFADKNGGTTDLAAAVEIPFYRGYCSVNRVHFRKDEVESFYQSAYEYQSSIRRYPVEWLPGFFMEGLVGIKKTYGKNLDSSPNSNFGYSDSPDAVANESGRTNYLQQEPSRISFISTSIHAGFGFGYSFELRRIKLITGFFIGPELNFVKNNYIFKSPLFPEYSQNLNRNDIVRLNQIELGYSF